MPRTLLLALLLLPPAPASAQEAGPVLAVARQALAEGDAGRALELARMARVLDDACGPRALVTMGRASLALDRPVTAHRLFRLALDGADEATRAQALSELARANERVATVRLDVQPAGASVTIDGAPVEWERGQRVALAPAGRHEIVARAPGHETRRFDGHFSAEGFHELHLILPPGDETRVEVASQPEPRSPVRRWLSGNLIQTAVGIGGAAGAGAWAADAAGRPDAGGRLELAYAHYELGVSLGMMTASQVHIALYDANDGRTLTQPYLLSLGGLMFGAAAAGVVGSALPTPSPEAALIGGLFAGGLVSTVGNLFLDRRWGRVVESVLATSIGIVFTQVPMAGSALITRGSLEGNEILDAYAGAVDGSSAHACQRVAAGDTANGAFADQMDLLSATCAQHRALGRAFEVALFTSLSTVLAGVGTGVLVLATGGDEDALDLSVAAGPSSLRLSGRF